MWKETKTYPARPVKWEYKITSWMGEKELNALGADGWEIVAVATDERGSDLIFKRRIIDTAPAGDGGEGEKK